ncbi:MULTISPECIES: 4'-phosphopantetheinyl transferase family protein [unclassified Streptomyces]|uniref:4'-phosphopantetheinyl transferase family protein n=1 Tax=unclassified Streptomyces TaxID=2593676 RepID=UPI00068CFAD2|nr:MULTISPECIES: 4'-phosphopantetheinyl transferase superfamily protein [unclassified Streptomyces]KPC79008.1 4'-phosphopantetheinyl transferase [Streptomyces sp. NRRL S-4]
MIGQLLAAEIASHEVFTDPPEATLLPEEEVLVRDSVDSRRREFTTGRHCARMALARLKFPSDRPILSGERGEPLWPDQVRGSITHCRGYRAAVVARVAEIASVGIDAEPDQPLPDGVLEAVALPREVARTKELLRSFPGVHWDRMLFSAKESVYKTWFPLTRRPLGFEDALIEIDPGAGTFSARILSQGVRGIRNAPEGFTGRWIAGNGLVVTAITVPAAERSLDLNPDRKPDIHRGVSTA